VIAHILPHLIAQPIAQPLTLGQQHIPLAGKQDDVVGQRGQHVGGGDAGGQERVRLVQRRRLQVRLVEQLGEDGGELLVGAGARLAPLLARLRVVRRRVEGHQPAQLELAPAAADADGGAVLLRRDQRDAGCRV